MRWKNRLFWLHIGRALSPFNRWEFWFAWKPYPDLTPPGYEVASRALLHIELTMPRLTVYRRGPCFNGFEEPR